MNQRYSFLKIYFYEIFINITKVMDEVFAKSDKDKHLVKAFQNVRSTIIF